MPGIKAIKKKHALHTRVLSKQVKLNAKATNKESTLSITPAGYGAMESEKGGFQSSPLPGSHFHCLSRVFLIE